MTLIMLWNAVLLFDKDILSVVCFALPLGLLLFIIYYLDKF